MVRIKKKLYKCTIEGCNREEPMLSKGMCKYHYTKKNMNNKVRTEKEDELETFFNFQVRELSKLPFSEHSGMSIKSPSRKNIAHLLPKRYFKSVADNNLNVIWLTWNEHGFFDNLLDKFDFIRLESEFNLGWEIAVSRIQQLLPLIPEEEQNGFYKKIKNYINSRYGSRTRKI